MLKIAILGDFVQTPGFAIDDTLLDVLQSTDFNIANLEAPFIDENTRPANGESGLYQKLPDTELLKTLNIKIVSLANNHISDFGVDGYRLTRKILDRNHILYFGAGESLEEAERSANYSCKGLKISCRGSMSRYLTRFHAGEQPFGTADITSDRMIEALKNDTADIKIIYNHWNQEYEDYPEPIYKEDAEKMINHSHVIAGSHSHCIQGIDNSSGRPIFYGLGNFSLPNINYFACRVSQYRPKCYHSFFPVLSIDNGEIGYEIYPFKISMDGAVLSSCSNNEAQMIRERLEKISMPLKLKSKEYHRFYLKHRERKMRKPLTRNHLRNSMNLNWYRVKYRVIHGIELNLASVLDKIGLRKAVRSRFKNLIEKIQKAK